MKESEKLTLIYHLSPLNDPRTGENIQHKFLDIVFMAVCAVISGCENWVEIADYAKVKKDWFTEVLHCSGPSPSHDTFRRVFCLLDFEEFQRGFASWSHEVKEALDIEEDQICIDGKRIRGSSCKSRSVKTLHMVNAWSTEASLCLAQHPTDKKSNEITAIPELLNLLDIKGCLISIDAMGCQKSLATEVVNRGGDYLFALKKNHKGLYSDIEELFRRNKVCKKNLLEEDSFKVGMVRAHGREEKKECHVLYLDRSETVPEFLPRKDWDGLKCLILLTGERCDKSTGEITKEKRYYISSTEKNAEDFLSSIRKHWEVENKLHWVLDVAFNEDGDRRWDEVSVKNFALLRQMCLNLLRHEPSKMSIKRKRRMSAMDNDFLLKVLFSTDPKT